MANTLTGTIKAALGLTYIGDDITLGTQKGLLPFANDIVVGSGTGSGQSDLAYWDTRTLAASTTEDLDLAGGLTSPIGETLTFVEITAIYIKAASTNGGNIVVGGDASAAFVGPFADSSDKVNIPAGESFLVTNMATGWTVTATTADLLQIENDDSGAAANYDIVLIGRSA